MSLQDDLQKLIIEHTRRLQKLKEQLARQGISVDPRIPLEIEDIEAAIANLQSELATLSKIVSQNPYRGLSVFHETHADFFFGRENFTSQLVKGVQQKNLVAVLGPSGSGKSSIIFAGLLPTIRRQDHWLIATFRPGWGPFRALAEALLPLLEPHMSEVDRLHESIMLSEALTQDKFSLSEVVTHLVKKNDRAERLLLVVDQLEELYTLCPDSKTRHHFLDHLLRSSYLSPANAPLHLVLTLRADFVDQALTYLPLADALQENIFILGQMTREELRRAIEVPALAQNVTFESGLVERILDDVGQEPGNLPLLEFALTVLWEQQSQGKLTHSTYNAIGGVEGALARHAEYIFAELSEAEQMVTRRVLMQMVHPGEGKEDTRRLAYRDEMTEAEWTQIMHLANARLVVTNLDSTAQETVEFGHEALIQGWSRLRDWISQDRVFLVWQERLRYALRQWQIMKRDEGALLRGALLTEAEGWLTERGAELSQAELEFIQASRKFADEDKENRFTFSRLLGAVGMKGLQNKLESVLHDYDKLLVEYNETEKRFYELKRELEVKSSEMENLAVPSIFISYAREDENRVYDLLYRRLKDKGFKPWIDKEDLLPGKKWENEINQSLKNADFIIICLSSKSHHKRGYIQREIKMAINLIQELPEDSIFLIPIRLEECEIPESLAKYHYVDLFGQESFDKVVQAILIEWQKRQQSIL